MKKCECSQTETIQRIQDELARKERQDNCEHRGPAIGDIVTEIMNNLGKESNNV